LQKSNFEHLDSTANKKVVQIDEYISNNINKLERLSKLEQLPASIHNLSKSCKSGHLGDDKNLREDFQTYVGDRDFYDILLLDMDGNIVFTMLHENDYGTNALYGKYKDTLLQNMFRDTLENIDTQIGFSKYYAPSSNLIGGLFMSTQVIDHGKIVGVLIAQLDPKTLIDIASDKTGLGKTGESPVAMKMDDSILYMVPLNHIPNAAFRYQVPVSSSKLASPMQYAISGEHGSGLMRDYVDIECICAWRYIPALGWGMVTKIDKSEAYAPLHELYKYAAFVVITLILMVSFIVFRFGRSLLRPINRLAECTKSLKKGRLCAEALSPDKSDWSEAYILEKSFVQMINNLELSQQELEKKERTIREDLLKFETIFENTKDGLAILDMQSNFLEFNDSYQEMTGFTREELLTKSCIGLSVPEDVERSIKAVAEVLEKGFIKNYEKSCIVKDGKIISIQMSIALMPDKEHLLISTRDITEKLKLDKKMQESEERFRQMFENLNSGVVIYEPTANAEDFIFKDINRASERIELINRDDLIGKKVTEVFPAIRQMGIFEAFVRVSQTGVAERFPISFYTDGRISGWRDNFVYRLPSGEIVAIYDDVTPQKQAEQALHDSEEYTRALLSSIGEGIYSVDNNGLCTYINEIALRLIGFDRDEVIGEDVHTLFHHSHPDGTNYPVDECPIYASIKNGSIAGSEEWFFNKKGQIFPVHMTTSPIHTGDAISGAIVSFRDISTQKQAEKALIESKQIAETSARSKSEFLANMSHEIRTPMNAILGLTGLVLDGELSPKQRDYLQKISYSSKTLLGILNDILDYSKIEAGKLDINEAELDVQALLHNISNLFMPKIEEKGLELFIDMPPNMPRKILADELRLTQVLSNLVSNAIKFTEKGSVTIGVELVEHADKSRDIVKFLVKDTGIGLDSTQAKKLFQPFTQADGSITRKYGGTGLGLSISQRLVDLMGGSMVVSSQLGAGSTFAFLVNVGALSSKTNTFDISKINAHRALVVDDQESSIYILTNYLTSWNIENDSCMSGEEALQKIQEADDAKQPYDIVLVDWKMPGISGLDVVN
jgi:PAS domain S-box-containing protein